MIYGLHFLFMVEMSQLAFQWVGFCVLLFLRCVKRGYIDDN